MLLVCIRFGKGALCGLIGVFLGVQSSLAGALMLGDLGGIRGSGREVGGSLSCCVAVKTIVMGDLGSLTARRSRSYLGWISAIERHGASILRGKA